MHDRNGHPIKAGDRVTLEGEITFTNASEEYCNVTVKITEKDQPHGPFNVQSVVVVNAKQTSLIKQVYSETGEPISEEEGRAQFLVNG